MHLVDFALLHDTSLRLIDRLLICFVFILIIIIASRHVPKSAIYFVNAVKLLLLHPRSLQVTIMR